MGVVASGPRFPLIETDVRREDFVREGMRSVIESWSNELNHGRGFLLVKGLPAAELGDRQVRTIFWGMGRRMGTPISQNSYGEMLGEVYDEGVKMGTGHMVRLWLKAYGTRRSVDKELFKDYDGVEKTLTRQPGKAGAA